MIKEFTINKDDQNVYFEIRATLKNDTNDEVRFVKYNCFYINNDGVVLGRAFDPGIDCTVGGGDDFDIEISASDVFIAPQNADITAELTATMYSKNTYNLGIYNIPENNEDIEIFNEIINSNFLAERLSGFVYKQQISGESSAFVGCGCGFLNKSTVLIDRVDLISEILDKNGNVVEYDQHSDDVRPNSRAFMRSMIFQKNIKKLKGAKLRIGLSVFFPVKTIVCSRVVKTT